MRENPTPGVLLKWATRARFAIGVAVLWAALHYLGGMVLQDHGRGAPLVLLSATGGASGGIPAACVALLAGAAAALLAGWRDELRCLAVLGLGLVLWSALGGTMDDWLKQADPQPGPPTGQAYTALLADYLLLAIVIVAATLLAATMRGRMPQTLKQLLQPPGDGGALGKGVAALLVTCAVAAIGMMLLTGPRLGETYRQQVLFAVAISFYAGVMIARMTTHAEHLLWYWVAPFVVGVGGLLWAAWKPGLGGAYANIDIIPAWGVVRALPIEMVGMGLIGVVWALRSSAPDAESSA